MARTSTARDEAYVTRVSDQVAEQVRQRLHALREQGRGPDELGTPDDVAARMVATMPQPSPWHSLGPFYSTKGIARVLGGVSRQAVDDRRRRRTLLALRTADGGWVYPQLQLDDRNRVLDGLAEVLACFDPEIVEDWTLTSLLTTAQPALGGHSIIDHLRDREPLEPVLELCRASAARLAR
ncbi:MAG: hypothetical protein QOJ67_1671 [Acidimicrobiaceae bacterium]|jgi:hypothetical protein